MSGTPGSLNRRGARHPEREVIPVRGNAPGARTLLPRPDPIVGGLPEEDGERAPGISVFPENPIRASGTIPTLALKSPQGWLSEALSGVNYRTGGQRRLNGRFSPTGAPDPTGGPPHQPLRR